MDDRITIAQDGDELVVRATFERCGCEPEVRYRRHGEPGEYRCGCGNELIVGPAAASLLSPVEGDATTGHRDATAPGAEPVEVAWRNVP